MDIALEALVVETVPGERRAFVASAKLCGASLGSIIGVGVLIGSYDSIGWPIAVLTCATLNAASLLPILFYPERGLRRAGRLRESNPARWRGCAALRRASWRSAPILRRPISCRGPNTLALLDLDVPLAEVGLLTGTVLPAINLVMALVAGGLRPCSARSG